MNSDQLSGSDSPASGTVKSADRVLDLFELLARWDNEMTHTDIAASLSIPKSSLTLLLRNLVARGYVDITPSKGYRLGSAFARLERQSGRKFDLAACVQPILTKLTAAIGETSALNRQRGNQAEVLATVWSSQRLASLMRVGDLAPLYATAAGKSILANLSDDAQKQYLTATRFESITPHTLRSAAKLRREIEEIRRTGLAYTYEEFTDGVNGIACAVIDEPGHPIASINIAVPVVRSSRQTMERAGQLLKRAAQALLRQIDQAGALKSL